MSHPTRFSPSQPATRNDAEKCSNIKPTQEESGILFRVHVALRLVAGFPGSFFVFFSRWILCNFVFGREVLVMGRTFFRTSARGGRPIPHPLPLVPSSSFPMKFKGVLLLKDVFMPATRGTEYGE